MNNDIDLSLLASCLPIILATKKNILKTKTDHENVQGIFGWTT